MARPAQAAYFFKYAACGVFSGASSPQVPHVVRLTLFGTQCSRHFVDTRTLQMRPLCQRFTSNLLL